MMCNLHSRENYDKCSEVSSLTLSDVTSTNYILARSDGFVKSKEEVICALLSVKFQHAHDSRFLTTRVNTTANSLAPSITCERTESDA